MGVSPVLKAIKWDNFKKIYGENKLVILVLWYDTICFCNKLSEIYDLIPRYSYEQNINVLEWNIDSFNFDSDKIMENISANGFRLPTLTELRNGSSVMIVEVIEWSGTGNMILEYV